MLIGDIPCFRSPVASDTINEKRNLVPGLQFVRRKKQSSDEARYSSACCSCRLGVDVAQKNMVCLSIHLISELPEILLQTVRLVLIRDIPCFRSPVASVPINEKRNPVPGLQFIRRKKQSSDE